MSQPINRFKADLRDIQFTLFEQLKVGDILSKGPFADWGVDEVKMVLDEVYRFSTTVTGPLNQVGDLEKCRLENGQVTTPTGFKEAWNQLYEEGWKGVSVSEEHGGQGAPTIVSIAAEELLSGSNTAFSMYPGLTQGAAEAIDQNGTEAQRALYARNLFQGKWGGTMCLTEPHAGSDVGAALSTAEKNGNGTYNIKGTKVFISSGDHDLTDNIIHLVLARVKGAVAGTKGLSLFIVPKYRVNEDGTPGESNDVTTGSIEHKLGINGSSTAVLNFGENDTCVGELVGGVEHQGMRQMFTMMNFSRIGVGVQSLGIASTAYLNTLEYARDRKQGPNVKNWKTPEAPRVPIIQHPNVRQMLMEMKAKVEGLRILIYKLAYHEDQARLLAGKDDEKADYHKGQVDLMTPLVKAYGSDEAFNICEIGIQVHGGAGFVQDYPLEQYLRDSKVFSIYEGTNSIQAMDLVGRKLGLKGGQYTQQFMGDVAQFVQEHVEHPELGEAVKRLSKAQEAIGATAMRFLTWFQSGEMEQVPLSGRSFLVMMSETVIGWLLLQAAAIAIESAKALPADHPDQHFYAGKKYAALWFANNCLPEVVARAETIALADRSPMDIPEEAFATI